MDDEPLVRALICHVLADLGCEADATSDGREAVDRYREALREARPFDLVILDLTVPGGMGGAEAFRELRLLDPNVRALVSSGYSEDPILSDHEKHGFVGVLSKPYTFDELVLQLGRALGRGATQPEAELHAGRDFPDGGE